MKSGLLLITMVATLLATSPGSATTRSAKTFAVASTYLESPELVGQARLRVMLWDVFDAALLAPNGLYDPDKPFALSLTYLRKLQGRKIVEKTIDEIKSQKMATIDELRLWQSQLAEILPDVGKSTTITAIRDAQAQTLIYKNNTLIGKIEDPRFTRLFFAIWLGERTSNPELRDRLLNSLQS